MYLTPYINSGDIDAARKLSLVTDQLDGIGADEQPESYSGFLTVRNDTNSNMFFWFIPATVNLYTSYHSISTIIEICFTMLLV